MSAYRKSIQSHLIFFHSQPIMPPIGLAGCSTAPMAVPIIRLSTSSFSYAMPELSSLCSEHQLLPSAASLKHFGILHVGIEPTSYFSPDPLSASQSSAFRLLVLSGGMGRRKVKCIMPLKLKAMHEAPIATLDCPVPTTRHSTERVMARARISFI